MRVRTSCQNGCIAALPCCSRWAVVEDGVRHAGKKEAQGRMAASDRLAQIWSAPDRPSLWQSRASHEVEGGLDLRSILANRFIPPFHVPRRA